MVNRSHTVGLLSVGCGERSSDDSSLEKVALTKKVSAVVASLVLVGTALVVVRTHLLAGKSRTASSLLDRFLAFLVADILAHTFERNPVAVCKASLVPSADSASVRETR